MTKRDDEFLASNATRQEKKAYISTRCFNILNEFEINYTTHNMGLHVKIPFEDTVIELWPTTEKWWDKSTKCKGDRIEKLLLYMKLTEEG